MESTLRILFFTVYPIIIIIIIIIIISLYFIAHDV